MSLPTSHPGPLASLSFPAIWTGYEHLAQSVAYYLIGDKDALKQLSLTCRLFRLPAHMALFYELQLMEDLSVHACQLRFTQFLVDNSPNTPPFCLRFVKKLSFCLSTDKLYSEHVIGLLDSIRTSLPALQIIHLYGYDGLTNSRSGPAWFQQFVDCTRPRHLNFSGVAIPRYILDFDFLTVQTIHFDICNLDLADVQEEEEEESEPQQWRTPLDAELVLRRNAKNWERVKEIVASSMNHDLLRILEDSISLKSLTFRTAFGYNCSPEDVVIPEDLKVLRLQVPNNSILLLPGFLRYLGEQASNLDQVDLFLELGWKRVMPWRSILQYTLPSILSSEIKQRSLRKVNFVFASIPHLLGNERIAWQTTISDVEVVAKHQDGEEPYVAMTWLPR